MPSSRDISPLDFELHVPEYRERLKDWVRTPGFRSIPRQDLPINRYKDIKAVYRQGHYSGAFHSNGSSTDTPPGYEPGYLWDAGDLDRMFRNMLVGTDYADISENNLFNARLKLLAKLSDLKSNLAVTLVEARKTSKLVVESCERIVNAYRAFRRGNIKLVAELLNLRRPDVHKNWLSYRYGWIPLMSDVKGQAELFAQQIGLGGRPLSYKVSHKSVAGNDYDNSRYYVPWGGGDPQLLTETLKFDQDLRLKVWVELESPHLATLQQTGLTNPALTVWELVPYSFVVDWFISVGDYLQALTALQGVVIKKAMVQTTNVYSYAYREPPSHVEHGGETWRQGEYSAKVSYREYVRDPNLSLEVPFTELRVNNPFSSDWKKMMTSLALLKGRMRV
jgi:hypothetical protein